jgi:hypothetical protein
VPGGSILVEAFVIAQSASWYVISRKANQNLTDALLKRSSILGLRFFYANSILSAFDENVKTDSLFDSLFDSPLRHACRTAIV